MHGDAEIKINTIAAATHPFFLPTNFDLSLDSGDNIRLQKATKGELWKYILQTRNSHQHTYITEWLED